MSGDQTYVVASPRPHLDVQLRRFTRGYRRRLRKLARTNARLNDLLFSYPAAAFTIAAGHGNPHVHGEAVKLIKNGAGLRAIAAILELPAWTRRLPPEAFSDAFGSIPGSDEFNRQIVNLIPSNADETHMWFPWMLRAYNQCDEPFALWLARQKFWDQQLNDPAALFPLAAYAWFSSARGTTARGLINEPWSPKMRFYKAIQNSQSWFMNMLLNYCRDDDRSTERWFVSQRTSGFRIVPLRTSRDLTQEGNRMENCVASYTAMIASGECLIYSVRRGNGHVATMEIRPGHSADLAPVITQLLGPSNASVGEAIRRAAEKWLRRQGKYPFLDNNRFLHTQIDNQRWCELWEPYWQAKQNLNSSQHSHPIQVHIALEKLQELV